MSHDLIESDNVDVDMFIENAGFGVQQWDIIEAEVVINDRSTPDYVDMVITPVEGIGFPEKPQLPESEGGYLGRDFRLDVDTQLRANTPGPEVTRLFTGSIANMTPLGDYTYEAIANDPTQEPFGKTSGSAKGTSFMNSTISIGKANPTAAKRFAQNYEFGQTFTPGDVKILISELVDIIVERAGIPESERDIQIEKGGIEVGETPDGETIKKGFDYEVTFSQWQVPIKDVLDRTTSAAQADWWFDRFGTFHFGPRIPDENIYSYELEYITDSSDGKTTPPYRSVEVIGDGVVSEEGWSRASLVSEDPLNSNGNVLEDDPELVEPTFTYRNMEINTKEEAENVKNDIIEQLRKQTGTGDITLVGFPELRPGDGVQMPNTEIQPMGGERYGVREVTHRLNSSDGFLTKVKVAGMAKEQEALYDEDVRG